MKWHECKTQTTHAWGDNFRTKRLRQFHQARIPKGSRFVNLARIMYIGRGQAGRGAAG
jgi:hypothetical protein